MVTSVCSKREWTHLTLADSWWKPLIGNLFVSHIWIWFDLHPEHPELSCSKTETCRGAVLCYRALPPRWPPVGSTTQWKRSCSSCRNPPTNAPTSGSPARNQCHHRKHCTRRTLASLGVRLVRRTQNHAHRKRNNTSHWKNTNTIFHTFYTFTNMLLFDALKFTWKFNPKLYPKQRGVTSAIVCQFSDPVQNKIHNLFSDGVVSACEVIGSIFFSTDQLLRMEQLAVRTSANFINHLVSRTRRTEKSAAQCKHGKHEHAMVLSVKSWQHQIPRDTKTYKKMLCSNTSGWQLAPGQPSRILARACLPLSQRRTFHVDIKQMKLWVARSHTPPVCNYM